MKGKGKGKGVPPPPKAGGGGPSKAAGYGPERTEEFKAKKKLLDEERMAANLEQADQVTVDGADMGLDAEALARAREEREATFKECPLCGWKCPEDVFDNHWTGHESCILEDWLYLGSKDNVNVKTMYRRGITRILNVANHLHVADDRSTCVGLQSFKDDLVEKQTEVGENDPGLKFEVRSYEWEDLTDWVKQNMLANIDGDEKLSIRAATRWIHDQKLADRKVLVHCSMGISRSTSTVMAYLMEYEGMTLKQAWEHALKCRRIIRPNAGYLQLLGKLEVQLKGGEPTLLPEEVEKWEVENGKKFDVAGTFDAYAKECSP